MKIKILCTVFARCQQLQRTTKEVVKELGIDATFEEVKDIKKIMEYPILTTPGLVIDEDLACSGQVPTKTEVVQLIINALDKAERSKK